MVHKVSEIKTTELSFKDAMALGQFTQTLQ